MARVRVTGAVAAMVVLASSSCVEEPALFTAAVSVLPRSDAGRVGPLAVEVPVEPVEASSDAGSAPVAPASPETFPDSSPDPDSDAGTPPAGPDASPAPAASRAVVADGPAEVLPRLGVEGGDPRLGACRGGVVTGIRPTANPSEEVFGQRLTFIEPICGTVRQDGPSSGDGEPGTLRVTRDDSILAWSMADGFLGLPASEVPDERLVWVPQPETVCPDATPVAVGLSGEYDPVAPDATDTSAIRSLFVECAPLVVAPNGIDVVAGESDHQLVSNADSFSAAGTDTYRSACGGGAVTTQIQVDAGFWLDGFVLGCSRLRLD